MRKSWKMLVGILLCATTAHAETFVVYPGDPLFRIQDAIDGASYGDTIQLAPGTHVFWVTSGTVNGWSTRAVAILKNGVTIESQSGPDVTFVDCETTTARHGFVGEDLDATTVVRGLTFLDCEDVGFSGNGKWGGGMLFYRSSVLIENCRFKRCEASGGGAVFLYQGDGAVIRDCIFDQNIASEFGGAVELYMTTGTQISGCTFASNDAGDSGGAFS